MAEETKENEAKPKLMQIVLSNDAIDELVLRLQDLKKEPHKVLRMGKEAANQIVFLHKDFKEAREKQLAEKKEQ